MDDRLLKVLHFSDMHKWSVNIPVFNNKKSCYPLVSLHKILKRVKEPIFIEEEQFYKRITVRLYGNGVVQRDEVIGKFIGTKRQFIAHAGQLIISRIDARNGAFGIVPDELEGAIVTNDFWLFDVKGALPQYLMLVLASKQFQKYWQTQSSGTTNRQRINEADFLLSKIPLPSFERQKLLVQDYNKKNAQADLFMEKADLHEKGIEEYLFEELGIQEHAEDRRNNMFRLIHFKDIVQWGYDKTVLSFPYEFIKYKPYSFGDNPSWIEEIKRGKSPQYSSRGSTVILNQKCNRLDAIDLSFAKTVDAEWLGKVDRTFFSRKGDILLNSTGEGTIGRASLVKEPEHTGLLFDSHVLLLRVNQKEVHPQLIVDLINSSFGQKQITLYKSAQATKQTELGIENTKKILFPLPELSVQNAIVEHITKEKDKEKLLRKKAEELYQLAREEFEKAAFAES